MNPKLIFPILIGAFLSQSSMLFAQTGVFSAPDPNVDRPPSGAGSSPPKLPTQEAAPAPTETPVAAPPKKAAPAQRDASRQAVYTAFKQFEPELNYLVKQSNPFKRRPYSFRAKRYLDRCSQHITAFPDDAPIVRSCILNEALVYYHSGNIAKAIPSLSQVAKAMADDPTGQKSVDLLINLGQKRPQEVLPHIVEIEKMPAYSTPEWREKFARFRLQVAAAEISKERDPLKKAKAMEYIATKIGSSDEGAKLWAQVGTLYLQAGQLYLAINAWQKIVDQFAQKPEAPIALWNIANQLENANELNKAVKAYHQYATTYASQNNASDALLRACTLYVALEQDTAINTCIAASSKHPKEVIILFDRILATREREQKVESFSDLLESFYLNKLPTSPEQKINALHRLFRMQRRLNQNNEETGKKILAISGPSPASPALRKVVAEVLFREVERAFIVFRDLKLLTDSPQSLSSSAQIKETAMQQVTAVAQPILRLNVPEWVTAYYWIMSQSYEHMVIALQGAVKASGAGDKRPYMQRAQQLAAAAQQTFKLGSDYAKKNRVLSIYSLRFREKDIRQREAKYSFDDYVPIPDAIAVDLPINIIPQLRGR